MKKLLLSLAAVCMAAAVNAQTLIAFPEQQGSVGTITLSNGAETKILYGDKTVGDITYSTITVGKSIDSEYNVVLSVEGGFKTGDVVKISGFIVHTDSTKNAQIQIANDDLSSKFHSFEGFVNLTLTPDAQIEEQTYTLTEDYASLILGRKGNTTAYITKLTVVRGGSTPVAGIEASDVVDVEYYNVAGVKVAEPVKGINIVKKTLSNGGVETTKVFVK